MAKIRPSILISAGIGLSIFAAFVAIAAAIVQNSLRLRADLHAAQQRPAGQALSSAVVPDVKGGKTYWLKMVSLGGGALVLGKTHSGNSPVLVGLDPLGVERSDGELPIDHCNHFDMAAVAPNAAMILCASNDDLAIFQVSLDGPQLRISPAGNYRSSGICKSMCQVVGSVYAGHHSWFVGNSAGGSLLGSGQGRSIPSFASVVDVGSISDLLAYSTHETLLASVDPDASVRVSSRSEDGTLLRSVIVARGSREYEIDSSPRLLFDGHEIAVIWRRHQTQHSVLPFARDEFVLTLQKLDLLLNPVGAAQRLTEDSHVAQSESYRIGTGGVLFWDQGARASWKVPSYIVFDSIPGLEQGVSRRFPFDEFPISLAQTERGMLALLPDEQSQAWPYRVVSWGR